MEKIDYKQEIIKILYEKNPLRLSKLEEKFLLRIDPDGKSLNFSAYRFDFSQFLTAIWELEDEGILKRDENSKKFYLTEKGKEEAEKILMNF
jgi:hypothetical protein